MRSTSVTAVVEISSEWKYRRRVAAAYSKVYTVGSHIEKKKENKRRRDVKGSGREIGDRDC